MSKLPTFAGKALIRVLKKFGCVVVRVRGSHHFLRHPDGRCTVVPVHSGETIGRGLMAQILKDCDIDAAVLARRL